MTVKTTLCQHLLRGKFFARLNLDDIVPVSNHDDLLVGDTLGTITINYEWRRFIVATLEPYLENAFDTTEDPDLINSLNQVRAFIADFYSP